MTKKRLGIFIPLLMMLGCASPSPRPQSQTPIAPTPTAKAADPYVAPSGEERVLTEWQEQKHQNFFDWPVDDARMTRGYLPNRKKPHLGLDLAAPKGTQIYSAQEGTVIYAGRDFRGFGKMVMVEGAQGWATLYAHLNQIQVKEGQKVSQGDQIGLMGRTGHATGVHLHFEIRRTTGPVDPLLYLPGGAQALREVLPADGHHHAHD